MAHVANKHMVRLAFAAILALLFAGFNATSSQAATYNCVPGQVLKYGVWNSSCVKGLQVYLNGFQNAHLTEDGNFGPATKAAVKAYQSGAGLYPDGSVGPLTRDRMCIWDTGIPTSSGATWPQIWAAADAIDIMCIGWGYHYD